MKSFGIKQKRIHKNMKRLTALFILIITPFTVNSQVLVGGLADFEIRKGQSGSSQIVNQTPNGNLNLLIPSVRLFGIGVLSEKWFLEATLQSDTYFNELSPIYFSLLNVNWLPVKDSDFMVTVGRFVMPYGRHPDQILSSENLFVNLPLSYTFHFGIDKNSGIVSGDLYTSTSERRAASMIYRGGYSQGLLISNQTNNQKLLYELAMSMSPVSVFAEVGEHDIPSFIGRIQYSPIIWLNAGISASYGPFMQRSPENEFLSRSELNSFRQTMIGGSIELSWLYYTLAVDVNYSHWSVPDHISNWMLFSNPTPKIWHYSTEFSSRLPFLPGGYAAVRYEIFVPEKIWQDQNYFRFADEAERAELVFGYKLNRQVTAKAGYSFYTIKPGPSDADVLTFQLSVGF